MKTIKKHWKLILGIFFLAYGVGRIFWSFPSDRMVLDVILTVAFIAFGIWDIYVYQTNRKS